jgi:hypothetical protein
MSALQIITNSRAKDFRACNRLHHLRYNLGYVPATEPETTRFGTLWHDGQDAWWSAIKAGLAQEDWLNSAIDAMRAKSPDAFDLARAEELMAGYHIRWCAEAYEVLEVEVEFVCDLLNPATNAASRTFQLAGKLDAIVRDREGRVLMAEHKTTSENVGVGSEYWRRLTLDAQISTYFRGARSLGYDIEGCLYDVVVKPKQQLLLATPMETRKYTKKTGELYANQRETDETIWEYRQRVRDHIAENPNAYFQRGDVTRLPEQDEDAAYDVWHIARMIREGQTANRHPKNPDACSRWGRTCAFFDVCCGIASLDDETQFKRIDNPHPELTQITRKPEAA